MIQEVPKELLIQFKYCMVCGIKLTHPYNIEIFNHGDKNFRYLRCAKCKTEWTVARHNFVAKKKIDQGGACRKCNGKISVVASKHKGNKHLSKAYYYTHYLRCNGCGTTYLDEKYKVINHK